VAGYLKKEVSGYLNEQGIRAIIHYHQIPELFVDHKVCYPNYVNEIKKQKKENIKKFNLRKNNTTYS